VIPSYIWFALLAMAFYGVVDFTYGRATRHGVTPGTMTVSQSAFVTPATGIWAWMEGTYAWTPPAFLGIAAGVFIFIGLWSFMKSLKIGEASVSTPIYRISFVITALIAIIFLGEPMTLRKGVGFLLAGASIFFISDFSLGGQAALRSRSILWALVAMCAVGLLNIVYKLGVSNGVSPVMMLHSQAVFFISIAWIYAYAVQGGPRFSRTGWAHASVTAVCFTGGIVSSLTAFQTGEASIVTPIVQLSFVVSVLMATWWMGERFTPRKVVGLALAVSTIAAFAGG
jgi:transporter family protein